MTGKKTLEIICPAGTPAALRAAVESGADSVYCGFRNETNARNFPGLNFDVDELREGVVFAHRAGVKVLVAINTYPRAGGTALWRQAVDDSAKAGADAVILADIGLAEYAQSAHPGLRRHLSVQASAANIASIEYFARAFDIKRVVLPRVLTVEQIAAVTRAVSVETEVFVFGGLCVMAEGRCSLSSYVTGRAPNMDGVCSPASHVRYVEEDGKLLSTLGGYAVNIFGADEPAGYPTLCKGRFMARGEAQYLFEEPTSLNIAAMLPELVAAGVTAVKIEGRQRGRAYIAKVIKTIRAAVDAVEQGRPAPAPDLAGVSEGGAQTSGAYRKGWR